MKELGRDFRKNADRLLRTFEGIKINNGDLR